ncbi:MFS transporter [Dermabacteraceae bacterium TAE3-ERU5]|nr:MFS transporter [Dermabacteraceae bacterium TAE3-ERU5]
MSFKGSTYGSWLVADTATQLGASLRQFAFPVLALLVSGSASMAGNIGALMAFTVAALSLAGGVLVDRYDRRRLLLASCAFTVVVFTCASLWGFFWGISVPLLFAVGVAVAVKAGLLGSASNVLLRSVVPTEHLPQAMSVNQGRDAAVELSGGPLSGALVAVSHVAPFVAEAALNLVAFLAALRIRPWDEANPQQDHAASQGNAPGKTPPDTSAGQPDSEAPAAVEGATGAVASFFAEALAGFKFIFSSRFILRLTVASALFMPLLNGVILLLVLGVISRGGSPISAGLLNSAVAVGVLAGSLLSAKLVGRIPAGRIALAAFLLPVPCALGAVLVPWFWLRMLCLLPILVLLPAGNASVGGFGMTVVPQEMLGRFFSVMGLMGVLVTPLVTLSVGYGLQYLGLQATGLALGAALLASALFAVGNRQMREIPTPDGWQEYARKINLLPAA